MIRKVALAAAAAAAFATPAAAESKGAYVSAGYTHFDLEQDVAVGGLTGRLGYRLGQHFGVEGEASFGVKDDELAAPPFGNVSVELENAYGVYGVGFLPVSENFDLFGRAGYGSLEIQGSLGGFSADAEADGLAFGVGGQYFFGSNFGVRGEYTRIEGDDEGADSFAISGVFKFGPAS
jgi:outer membrane immunogenic protein